MRPNILFIMADQFRADAIGDEGGWVRTPNINRLAAGGCLFRNVYANSAECVPSRMSLATGLYPHQTGVDRNISCSINPAFPTWMHSLAAAGYRMSLFGKTHLHPHAGDLRDRLPLMRGLGFETVDETVGPRAAVDVRTNMTELWEQHGEWETYRQDMRGRIESDLIIARPTTLPSELYYDHYVGRKAREHIAGMPSGEPWFCWVSFGGPHEPWDAPEPYASMYKPAEMPPPRPPMDHSSSPRGTMELLYASRHARPAHPDVDFAALRANYAGNVTLIDHEIGLVLSTLEERGESERTLIVFTSDHGEMNGDYGLLYKGNFLDPAVKVPLIIVPPGGSAQGRQVSVLAELMDVGATMRDYGGGKEPANTNARSLRGVIEGAAGHREALLSEFSGYTCVITERTKVEFAPDSEVTLLVDRVADPMERRDVKSDPAYRSRGVSHQQLLRDLVSRTPPVPSAVVFSDIW
jgi:arylsulfatase